MSILTLKEYNNSRIFVVGSLEGDYYKLIDFLFNQFFCYKDILVLTGNIINEQNEDSNKLLEFLNENNNCFCVKGYNEKIYVENFRHNKSIATKSKIDQKYFNLIEQLPLVIEVSDFLYVVHSGVNFDYGFDKQTPEYTIYKTNSVKETDWYNKDTKPFMFCFSNSLLEVPTVNSGYNLGSLENKLYSLILYKDNTPILIDIN